MDSPENPECMDFNLIPEAPYSPLWNMNLNQTQGKAVDSETPDSGQG